MRQVVGTIALCSTLIAACGGGGEGGMTGRPDAPVYMVDAGCPPPPDAGAAVPPNGQLAGVWAMYESTAADVDISAFHDVQTVINIYLETITQTGTSFMSTEKLCHLQIDDATMLVSTRVLPG